jgi:hypothetical protein
MTDHLDDHEQNLRRFVDDKLELSDRFLRATFEGRRASAADTDFALRFA